MRPLAASDRLMSLDILRGIALFGVLMVNILTEFRVSLFEHLLNFHTHQGAANRWVDILMAGLLESKAITLFSCLFGVGVCIQAERTQARGVGSTGFLIRRFAILLVIGLAHMLLIWNGDILSLYALCGLLLIPLLKLRVGLLVTFSIAAITMTFLPIYGGLYPVESLMRAHAKFATHVYSQGSFGEIMEFRWYEARVFMLPLLVNCMPRTFGLMLLGIAAWRSGVVAEPNQHRRFLRGVSFGGCAIGSLGTGLLIFAASSGKPPIISAVLLESLSYVPLALGFASMFLLWLKPNESSQWRILLAAGGQMALSNYILQSIFCSLLFYGYGLGLFGRLGSAPVALIGVAIYFAQLLMSRAWLHHFRFGPLEWLWRSLTYGRAQSMKRRPSADQG